ncbi:DUF2249 domain-containing protein [Streptosporangium sp. NPDC000396]|uniref:DUF2249 domain-containing protein n=1 Tax=Streptosporangium sp. NPDC000396 TaxID=3366185 RepID=UPI0036922711
MTERTKGNANDVVLETIRAHHDRLGRTMSDHAVTIGRSIDRLASPSARQAVLVAFCTGEVLPHAVAEEETLYRVAADLPETRLLVRAMSAEHVVLRDLVGELERASTPGEAVSTAAALNALFQSHLSKENDVLLPALADAGVDLGALLDGMHEILGEPAPEQSCGCGGCGCGAQDLVTEGTAGSAFGGAKAAAGEFLVGELDVRRLVPARRHEEIFATFRELPTGMAFVLVNDHDPRPLYYQFAAEHPGEFTWDYTESGPAVWRVRVGRP